jgi:hypothetical protein
MAVRRRPAIIAYDLGLHEMTVQTFSGRWPCTNARSPRGKGIAMIKFICVTDREVENGYCTLCTSKVTSPYLRQRATGLLYCGTKCYWEHCNVALVAIEDYGRRMG